MSDYRLTIPTVLTFARIALIPFIVFALLHNYWITACVLFAISAITDVLDGSIARRYNQQTALGALLDPLADKLLMIALFVTFSYKALNSFTIPRWFIVLVFLKEAVLVIGSLILICTKYRFSIRPTMLGKFAMFLQVLFVGWLFIAHFLGYDGDALTQIFLYTVAAVIIAAFGDYACKVYKVLKHTTYKRKNEL